MPKKNAKKNTRRRRNSVRLKNFSGTVTRKSNGQVVVRGRKR